MTKSITLESSLGAVRRLELVENDQHHRHEIWAVYPKDNIEPLMLTQVGTVPPLVVLCQEARQLVNTGWRVIETAADDDD